MDFVEARADFQKHLDDEEGVLFPLVLNPGDNCGSVPDAIAANRDWIDAKLIKSGAILFRGFDVVTAKEFNAVVDALGFEEFPYVGAGGAATRTRIHGMVLTSNENYPPEQDIGFHNEACYLEKYPTRLMFFCEVPPPPGSGGSTTICHGSLVYKRLLSEHKSLLDDLSEGFHYLDENGHKITERPYVVYKEDRAGRTSWFNSLGYVMEDKSKKWQVRVLGSGKVLTMEDLQPCRQIMEQEKVELDWQEGDMVLLDNTAVQHGKTAFFSERKLLVALAK